MDPASVSLQPEDILCSLCQNGLAIESYVEFQDYCHLSSWDDRTLMDCFRKWSFASPFRLTGPAWSPSAPLPRLPAPIFFWCCWFRPAPSLLHCCWFRPAPSLFCHPATSLLFAGWKTSLSPRTKSLSLLTVPPSLQLLPPMLISSISSAPPLLVSFSPSALSVAQLNCLGQPWAS